MKCTAKRTNGQPCSNWAIKGGSVCRNHGGSAPQVREAARKRLLEAADPVAAELVRLATQADSESVRVQAARDILDRAGYGAKQQIESEVTLHDDRDAFVKAVEELEREFARRGEGGGAVAEDEAASPG